MTNRKIVWNKRKDFVENLYLKEKYEYKSY